MNEKDIKTKSDKEDSEDFQFNIDYHKEDESEDIPFREYWKRETVESIKETLCSWVDHNQNTNLLQTTTFIVKRMRHDYM